MRWTVHGERVLYDSAWVRLAIVDVEVPGGARFDHHVVRSPRHAAGVVVVNNDREILLLWRHRFVTDSWGWEIPAGAIDGDETVEAAARREVLEETGWEVAEMKQLVSYHPMNGISDQTFHLFFSHDSIHRGPPTDPSESERIEWVPLADVYAAIRNGKMSDGLSLTALTYAIAVGDLL